MKLAWLPVLLASMTTGRGNALPTARLVQLPVTTRRGSGLPLASQDAAIRGVLPALSRPAPVGVIQRDGHPATSRNPDQTVLLRTAHRQIICLHNVRSGNAPARLTAPLSAPLAPAKLTFNQPKRLPLQHLAGRPHRAPPPQTPPPTRRITQPARPARLARR